MFCNYLLSIGNIKLHVCAWLLELRGQTISLDVSLSLLEKPFVDFFSLHGSHAEILLFLLMQLLHKFIKVLLQFRMAQCCNIIDLFQLLDLRLQLLCCQLLSSFIAVSSVDQLCVITSKLLPCALYVIHFLQLQLESVHVSRVAGLIFDHHLQILLEALQHLGLFATFDQSWLEDFCAYFSDDIDTEISMLILIDLIQVILLQKLALDDFVVNFSLFDVLRFILRFLSVQVCLIKCHLPRGLLFWWIIGRSLLHFLIYYF